MTIQDLMRLNVSAFNQPKDDFEMRTYLNRRFTEQSTEKILSKRIEKRLGGNGENK